MGFGQFLANIPEPLQKGIALSLVCLSIGGSVTLARSSGIQVSKEEIKIERQAVRNQNELEKALLVITAQEQTIERTKTELNKISRKDNSAKRIVQDIKIAEESIPKLEIREIEQTISDSKSLLNPDSKDLESENIEDDW